MLAQRRVKVVATIGPASNSKEKLKSLIEAGMNVARLNFSHGSHEDHIQVINNLRELSKELRAPVSILQDLQGPKIRVGKFENGFISLEVGQKVRISPSFELGKGSDISTDFPTLHEDVSQGERILLDDGLIELAVDSVDGDVVNATVIYGGKLKDRKGMNVPGANLSVDCLTEKDLKDLAFGLEQQVDYVALSFVRSSEDMVRLRKLVDEKSPKTKTVAKIEMLEALDDLQRIVKKSDAIMVARGDLAIEIGQTRLASVQKKIIKECNRQMKPVITATQMLDSMVNNPRPTRAEITDVANAILDGTDALMLSAESAAGNFPAECVSTMHEISMEVEKESASYYIRKKKSNFETVPESIAASASLTAEVLDAKVILCLTTSGKTATFISGFRPKAQIIAATHITDTLNRLELVWGIQTIKIDPYDDVEDLIARLQSKIHALGLADFGEKVVLTMGQPIRSGAKTNTVRVFTIDKDVVQKLDMPMPLRFLD
ncbi:MAG: pyruvate kinase [Bdellovibrionota bacterium]|nr:pyruvate kinase [Bdellovibrionota bacterium]